MIKTSTINPLITLKFSQLSAQVLKDLIQSKFSSVEIYSRNTIKIHDIIPLEIELSDFNSLISIVYTYRPGCLHRMEKLDLANTLNKSLIRSKCILNETSKPAEEDLFYFKYIIDMSVDKTISNKSIAKSIVDFQNEVIEGLCHATHKQ